MEKVRKSEAEWRAQLTPEQFRVTREKGTELPFSGAYCTTKKPGTYACICCGEVLFDSTTKFNSGCGWPSFYAAISDDVVEEMPDKSHGMVRTEILCRRCDAHLGHVFNDGPAPTGMRYCVNSVAVRLQTGAAEPGLAQEPDGPEPDTSK